MTNVKRVELKTVIDAGVHTFCGESGKYKGSFVDLLNKKVRMLRATQADDNERVDLSCRNSQKLKTPNISESKQNLQIERLVENVFENVDPSNSFHMVTGDKNYFLW